MKTIIKSTGLYLTDEEETELMEGRYQGEVKQIQAQEVRAELIGET